MFKNSVAELRCGQGSSNSKVEASLLYHVNFHDGLHELIKNNYFLIIMSYKFIAGNPEMTEKRKKEKANTYSPGITTITVLGGFP